MRSHALSPSGHDVENKLGCGGGKVRNSGKSQHTATVVKTGDASALDEGGGEEVVRSRILHCNT